jgi:hypothetical protein
MLEAKKAEWEFAKSTYERWHNAPTELEQKGFTLIYE